MVDLSGLKRPETLTVATARHIGDAIVSGAYPPEAALPESVLASEIRVSRGTIREALRLLAEDGLVELFPHRGARVAALTPRAVRETYSLRSLLEPFAARIAVESGRIGPAMDSIEDAYSLIERAANERSVSAFVDADLAFHDSISRLCDHAALLEMLGTLRPRIRRFMYWGRAIDPSDVWIEHADIIASLRGGDPDGAEQAIRDHIVRAGELLATRLEAQGRPALAGPGKGSKGDGRPRTSLEHP